MNNEQTPNDHNSRPILKPSKKGFAGMSKEKRTEIASKGGKRAHELGVAHKITPEEASYAGRIGGESIGKDREHMSRIGKKGSAVRWKKKLVTEENQNSAIDKGTETEIANVAEGYDNGTLVMKTDNGISTDNSINESTDANAVRDDVTGKHNLW